MPTSFAEKHSTTVQVDQKESVAKPVLSPMSETSSIAPEDQARVEEGWREGVGGMEEVDIGDTPPLEQVYQQKELTHKIHGKI